MSKTTPLIVVGKDGLRGTIEATDRLGDGPNARVEVRFEDDRVAEVPVGALVLRDDGTYYLPLSATDLAAVEGEEVVVLPVVAEEAEVRKQVVETGRVRVAKTVRQREEVVDIPLRRDEVQVERVPVNRVVEGPVEIRHEGDTTIIPLVEEVLVVEKRLMLREELRVTTRQVEERRPQRVTLRAEEATVERVEPTPRRSRSAKSPS
jgi:uncharacterized protein (TIGR02271 family)